MKKIKSIFLLVLTVLIFASCNSKENLDSENSDMDQLVEEEQIDDNTMINSGDKDEKLSQIKKKLSLKGLISKGDMYFNDKEYNIALAQYLKVLKKIPNDKETIRKIGDIYYEQKKWDKAYEYYKKIKDYSLFDKRNLVYSLMNSTYGSDIDYSHISEEIDSFNLGKEETFYFKNSALCSTNFSKCRANFEEYFKNVGENGKINFSDLQEIRNTFINYKNFQLEDLVYKSALINGGFYKNGFYFVSLKTGQNILKDNPNYKPILKIAAKSAYEIGNYNLAKDYILKYNKIETNDAEASYFLGRIYEKLGEKVLSSVHFSKALTLGYADQNDIRRRLIFLYYELQDTPKMINMFKEMLDSKDDTLTINDYNLALHYLILNNDLTTAKKYSEIAKEKFKDSELFYTYYAWIILQNKKLTKEQLDIVKENLEYAGKINNNTAMLSMVRGIYYLKTGSYDKAEKEFKEAKKLDTGREYYETTDYWLKLIQNEKNGKKSN